MEKQLELFKPLCYTIVMNLSEKRIKFSELTTHLEFYLLSEDIPFAVDWVKRDVDTQAKLVNNGASKTMKSKHLQALAKDYLLFDYDGNYLTNGDHLFYKKLGAKAKELGLTWGGDWGWDYGHVEWKDE